MKNPGVNTKRLRAFPLAADPPAIRPGVVRRTWMDETPSRFAYRCLPLTIANTFGWEILSPVAFEAAWNGGPGLNDTSITVLSGSSEAIASHFGSGVITFHVGYLFRTEATVSLMVMGPPNLLKDGIGALSGVVETGWAPYPFTMNWRFTRPGVTVRFEEGEPFCFIVPVQIGLLEGTRPEIVSLGSDPRTKERYQEWAASRASFIEELPIAGSEANEARWQKRYSRGLQPDGSPTPYDHASAVTVREFANPSGIAVRKP